MRQLPCLKFDYAPGAEIEQDLPPRYNGFIVILEGGGEIGSSSAFVAAGQIAWLTRSDEPSVVSITGGDQGIRALLFAGLPLNEPVAARGPFVMNTEEELDEAFTEFRAQGEKFVL